MTLAQRLALLQGKNNNAREGQDRTGKPGSDLAGDSSTPASLPSEPAAVSLMERLKRLHGSSDGSRNTSGRTKLSDIEVARHLRGDVIAPGLIQVIQAIPLASWHGRVAFSELACSPLAALGLQDEASIGGLLFLDTETTGLAGGTGTLPFMVCLARIQGEEIQLGQWILTGFAGEAALLETVFTWIKPSAHLVSYNGKSFDVPLLITRYRLVRQTHPFADKPHIDLLHLTRRACGHGWDDCRLQTAEQRLLGFRREDDFPSHLIPQAWSEFVRGGAVQPLAAIAEHNRRDVLSLAALLAMLARIYAEPGHEAAHALKVAEIHVRRGHAQHAIEHLTNSAGDLDEAALLFLAKLHRMQRQDAQALAIWHQLRQNNCVAGIEALAKYHEHVTRDLGVALELAEKLLSLQPARDLHAKRRDRLRQRLARPKA
ncbi:hypothetical protein C8R31_102171 [Nitrosospira sp. Nsp2]|uniref:ribonuclease H-like domain-containing protein n=1 Tax=Nitrosospira sp. Nsp2 TaxID=136548 RepID=UPI000D31077E|nr:ribonuclease H-like domain-containing protein [Nitrosospira sp. Nsp2]PTR16157.1 hypothetical protein C8R31_102171 [Nitrosospira sp. Nsp2]